MELSLTLNQKEIKKAVMQNSRTAEYLQGKIPKKWVIIPNKIINIVV